MQYFSTNRISPVVSFAEAVLLGQPEDKGLYFPSEIPLISPEQLTKILSGPNAEIALKVIRPYVGIEIPDDKLFDICAETVNFEFPLVKITDSISTLELFHGPTLAFKDVGARFMSRCLQYFAREKTIVVVATSGDTGGAVAAGFHGVDGIEVVILYPKSKVSHVQELQLTTLGGNVTTLELHGTFDDCQALAKQALADTELRSKAHFTSANSINVARWLPQQFYYFYALKQWQGEPPIFSVPSGNFGNLAAGVLAHISGLPAAGFIAACNANDTIPNFMKDRKYDPKPSVSTLSSAMDVGDPSNFVRILEIFEQDFPRLASKIEAVSVADDETAAAMRQVYQDSGYVLDPHGAVAYKALADHIEKSGGRGILLETAHPIKFAPASGMSGARAEPDAIKALAGRPKRSIEMEVDYDSFKELLISKI